MGYLCLRLEQIFAGTWPTYRPQADAGAAQDRVVTALLKACKGSFTAVREAYEALVFRQLAGGASASAVQSEISNSRLQGRLLQSMAVLYAMIIKETVTPSFHSAFQRQAFPQTSLQIETDALASACERCAQKARSLNLANSKELATLFEEHKRTLDLLS